jgi:glycerophosphoryl diester phosphodiesterase
MLIDEGQSPARPNGLTRAAQAAGLAVHPYTFRSDALPAYAASFEELLRLLVVDAGVDGIFTDFPDKALNFLQNTQAVAP